MLIVKKDVNLLDNVESHKDEKLVLDRPNIEDKDINLVSKSLKNRSYARNMLLGDVS